jgi:hypothetical protein
MSEEANLLKRLPLLSDLTDSARIEAQLSGSGVILCMTATGALTFRNVASRLRSSVHSGA